MTRKDLHFAIVVACVNNVGIMGPHLVPVATPPYLSVALH